jgi:hypothetical protein
MTGAYNVVDADGHILRAARSVGQVHGSRIPRARAAVRHRRKRQGTPERRRHAARQSARNRPPGSVGIRQAIVKANTLKYSEGRKGGFDPHARIVDMDARDIIAQIGRGTPQELMPQGLFGCPGRPQPLTTGGYPDAEAAIPFPLLGLHPRIEPANMPETAIIDGATPTNFLPPLAPKGFVLRSSPLFRTWPLS